MVVNLLLLEVPPVSILHKAILKSFRVHRNIQKEMKTQFGNYQVIIYKCMQYIHMLNFVA